MLKECYIKKAQSSHGDEYIYDLLPDEFKVTDVIDIICRKHGVFSQIARNHTKNIKPSGCPICGKEKARKNIALSFEEFCKRARKCHGDEYEYFEDGYTKATEDVKIKHKKCGNIFIQKGIQHISGRGCNFCHPPKKVPTQEEFIEKLSKTHPNLEVLSKYNGADKPVTVRCKIHDYIYKTTPHRLNSGANCQKCYDDRRGDTLKRDVIEIRRLFNSVHHDKYDYPYLEDEYVNNKSKLTIICPEHGEFHMSYNKHYNRRQGCRLCNESHIERDFAHLHPQFQREKRFKWLGLFSLDFYDKENNVAYECQGDFHFRRTNVYGGKLSLIDQIRRDKTKRELCEKNHIVLKYIIPKRWLTKIYDGMFGNLYKNITIISYNEMADEQFVLY